MAGPSVLPPPQIREDVGLAQELTERLPQGAWVRGLAVTDLIEPRRAFFRHTVGPAPIPFERRAKLDSGRLLHRAVDLALQGEGTFEVRLRRRGVSARIDLLADVPVELKTGESAAPEDLLESRPEYVEQVAMYCALAQRREARLVHVYRPEDGPPVVRAVDVAFDTPDSLSSELDARSSALRSALAQKTPAGLPRCRWFDKGCEYRAGGLCDCTGDEADPSSAFLDHVVGQVVRGDLEARWRASLERIGPVEAPRLRRYRDLVYPRRAYFELTDPAGRPETGRPTPADHPPSEVYDGAVGAVEGGPLGDVHRLREAGPTPEEEVPGWRGEPYVVRTSRAWARVRPDEAVARFPQYALELGFRCAVTSSRRGRVVLAYERATDPRERIQVLEYTFGDGLTAYAEEYRARWEALEHARGSGRPDGLAPCAGWMTAECPYRSRCGCAEELARSQR